MDIHTREYLEHLEKQVRDRIVEIIKTEEELRGEPYPDNDQDIRGNIENIDEAFNALDSEIERLCRTSPRTARQRVLKPVSEAVGKSQTLPELADYLKRGANLARKKDPFAR